MNFDPSGGDVIGFARAALARGEGIAFATLAGIDGSSPRAIGAQMAVAESGAFAGSISSGCLERAILQEAKAAMTRGAGGLVRYGKGSRFLDVVLPCGSGVDILFTVNPDPDALAGIEGALAARREARLRFSAIGHAADGFERVYRPRLRLVAAGYDPELTVVCSLAGTAGFEICALSPEAAALGRCECAEKILLQSAGCAPDIAIDDRTSCVLLFHDREWERALAPRFIRSPAFYVGAVGGTRTAEARRAMLLDDGLAANEIDRLSGPVGLVPMTRDPASLAVSILAEIIAKAPRA